MAAEEELKSMIFIRNDNQVQSVVDSYIAVAPITQGIDLGGAVYFPPYNPNNGYAHYFITQQYASNRNRFYFAYNTYVIPELSVIFARDPLTKFSKSQYQIIGRISSVPGSTPTIGFEPITPSTIYTPGQTIPNNGKSQYVLTEYKIPGLEYSFINIYLRDSDNLQSVLNYLRTNVTSTPVNSLDTIESAISLFTRGMQYEYNFDSTVPTSPPMFPSTAKWSLVNLVSSTFIGGSRTITVDPATGIYLPGGSIPTDDTSAYIFVNTMQDAGLVCFKNSVIAESFVARIKLSPGALLNRSDYIDQVCNDGLNLTVDTDYAVSDSFSLPTNGSLMSLTTNWTIYKVLKSDPPSNNTHTISEVSSFSPSFITLGSPLPTVNNYFYVLIPKPFVGAANTGVWCIETREAADSLIQFSLNQTDVATKVDVSDTILGSLAIQRYTEFTFRENTTYEIPAGPQNTLNALNPIWTIYAALEVLFNETTGSYRTREIAFTPNAAITAANKPPATPENTIYVLVPTFPATTTTSTTQPPPCFLAGAMVHTDQGIKAIETIDAATHTIGGKRIVAITADRNPKARLVLLRKDLIDENVPDKDTLITSWHKVLYKGNFIIAGQVPGLKCRPYKDEILYNVLMDTHETMVVNNMICKTMPPKHPGTAKYRA